MIGKPLCIKCSDMMYEAGYPVEYKHSSGLCEAVCARCGRNKKVDAYLLSDTPDRSLVDRIPKWVEADKDGRLFILPIKKGGVLYLINKYGGIGVREFQVDGIHVTITGRYRVGVRYGGAESLHMSSFEEPTYLNARNIAYSQENNISTYGSAESLSITDLGETAFLSFIDAAEAQEGSFSPDEKYLTEEQLSFFSTN